MTATAIDRAKLAKVLALTASDHDGEALSAFQAAQRLLANAGMSFLDLMDESDTMSKPSIRRTSLGETRNRAVELEQALRKTQARLEESAREKARQEAMAIELSNHIKVLERVLEQKTKECRGWRDRAWRMTWLQKTAA